MAAGVRSVGGRSRARARACRHCAARGPSTCAGCGRSSATRPRSPSPAAAARVSPCCSWRSRGGHEQLRVGVEEPGYPSLRRVPARFGASVRPAAGRRARPARRRSADRRGNAPTCCVVTPSHQYPLGGSLPVDRRQALLDWARRNRVVIVEDDYDSELRYTSQPLPALAALDDPDDGQRGAARHALQDAHPGPGDGLPGPARPAGAGGDRGPARIWASRSAWSPSGRSPPTSTPARCGCTPSGCAIATGAGGRRSSPRLSDVAGCRGLPDGRRPARGRRDRRGPKPRWWRRWPRPGVQVSPLSQYWSGASSRSGIVFGFGAVSEHDLATALRTIAAEVVWPRPSS